MCLLEVEMKKDREDIVARINASIAACDDVVDVDVDPVPPPEATSAPAETDLDPALDVDVISAPAPTRSSRAAEKIFLAKRRITYLRSNEFRVDLGKDGALLVSDTAGLSRVPTRYAAKLFDEIAAGLAEDPTLLDEARPSSADRYSAADV